MGIKQLSQIITELSPGAIKHFDIKTLFGRKVAIDASMSIYQFLIAVRQRDGEMLTNEQGETTSHLMGFFYRTLRMVDHGIKPMYVFDGKPPDLKAGVLKQRFGKRQEAIEAGEEQKETADVETLDKLSRRTVKVTREHNEECRRLLKLMGIPVIVAPGEAEAQCAELARGGKVYGAGSEDMDTLTFNSPILLRHLTFSEAKKEPIAEYNFEKVLTDMQYTREKFIDLCILLGCDYLEPIKGIGPKMALKLMAEHGSLANVMKHLQEKQAEADDQAEKEAEKDGDQSPSKDDEKPKKKKGSGAIRIPAEYPWEEAQQLFLHPDVTPADQVELEWHAPDVDGLVEFLVKEKGFSEDRVRKGAERLQKMLQTKQQGRLDGFFSAAPKSPGQREKEDAARKSKMDALKGGKGKRKGDDGAGAKGKKIKK